MAPSLSRAEPLSIELLAVTAPELDPATAVAHKVAGNAFKSKDYGLAVEEYMYADVVDQVQDQAVTVGGSDAAEEKTEETAALAAPRWMRTTTSRCSIHTGSFGIAPLQHRPHCHKCKPKALSSCVPRLRFQFSSSRLRDDPSSRRRRGQRSDYPNDKGREGSAVGA